MERRNRTRALFALALAANCTALLLVAHVVDVPTAIKASYTTIGLLVALVLVEAGRHRTGGGWRPRRRHARWSAKCVVLLAGLSVALLQIEAPLWTVLGVLVPLGYVLLFVQYVAAGAVTRSLLLQLGGLFAVTSYAKVASVYFYQGHLDLITHTAWTERLVATGDTSHLSATYVNFPGLHVSSGTLSVVTDATVNDAILTLGLLSFVALLASVYAFLHAFSGLQSVAFLAVLFLAVSESFVFYSNYFFPQSLGLTLLFALLYLGTRERDGFGLPTYVAWGVVTGAALLTHHFSFVLTIPIVLVLLGYEAWLRSGRPGVSGHQTPANVSKTEAALLSDRSPRSRLHPSLVATPYLLAVGKLGVYDRAFFDDLFELTARIADALPNRGTGTPASAIVYLDVPPVYDPTPAGAIDWLASVDGVNQMLLVAIFATGVVALLFADHDGFDMLPVALIAIAGSILVLETPLTVFTDHRLALPFAVFVFFVAAYGVHWTLEDASGAALVPFAVVLVLLAATGPMIAMQDVQNYGATPVGNNEYSEAEYHQMESTVSFVERHHEEPVSSLRTERFMYQYFDDQPLRTSVFASTSTISSDVQVSEDAIEADRPVVYNERWAGNQVGFFVNETVYDASLLVSRDWLLDYQRTGNHTYDAGAIGLVEHGTGRDAEAAHAAGR